MRNPTVRDVIEFLQTCDQNASVCRVEWEVDGTPFYSAVEMIKKDIEASFIDDSGDDCYGKIIAIY